LHSLEAMSKTAKPAAEVDLAHSLNNAQFTCTAFIAALAPCGESKDTDVNMKHLSQAITVSNRRRFKLVDRLAVIAWVFPYSIDILSKRQKRTKRVSPLSCER
jgi:hypothetical protein